MRQIWSTWNRRKMRGVWCKVLGLFVLVGLGRAAWAESFLPEELFDELPPAEIEAPAAAPAGGLNDLELGRLIRRDLAAASLQQLSAARGGTLGIPSVMPAEGLQANIDAQLLGQNANLYTQLGGLEVTEHIQADAFAELMEQDLPRHVHGPLTKEVPATKLSTAGLRVHLRLNSKLLVTQLQDSSCMNRIREWALTREAGLARDNALTKVRQACDVNAIKGESAWMVSVGGRILRRSALQEDGEASIGGAFEAMLLHAKKKPSFSWSAYAGVSGMRIESARDMLGANLVEYPRFSSLRVSGGFELRGSKPVNEHDSLPRIGIYGVASHTWWHDPYTAGTAERRIQGSELEVGIYAGGRFQKNFQGMVVARFLRPLESEGTTFILSLVPAGNTAQEQR